jgi:hypothetical protein
MPATLGPCDVRLTRTPLAGGASTTIEERIHGKDRRILGITRLRRTMTQGHGSALLLLDNLGNPLGSWGHGDSIKIELRPFDVKAYVAFLDGWLGRPKYDPYGVKDGHWYHPTAELDVRDWTAILDLRTVPADKEYLDTAWTTIVDDIITQALGAGFARSITTDTTKAVRYSVSKGMTLRAAIDPPRSALNAGADKWDYDLRMVSGAKTFRWFKRTTTIQRTYDVGEILPGSHRDAGDLAEVMNEVRLRGDTVPEQVVDKTALTRVGAYRLNGTALRLAQPFIAKATPLYSYLAKADRTVAKDPPTVKAYVARNSDNHDVLSEGLQKVATVLRNAALASGTIAEMFDQNTATGPTWSLVSTDVDKELVVWDLGSGKSRKAHHVASRFAATNANVTFKVWGSNDDSNWTELWSRTSQASDAVEPVTGAPAGPYRYYKLTATSTVNGSFGPRELHIIEFGNLSADYDTANEERNVHYQPALTATMVTNGADEKELLRVDLGAAKANAKAEIKHSESSANASLNIRAQQKVSGTWTDVGVFPSSTATVVDTVFIEDDDRQEFRFLLDDDRTDGSANITTTVTHVSLIWHMSDAWGTPLKDDKLKGSEASWTVNNLQKRPALLEAITYPAPRLTLTKDRYYWMIHEPQTGAATDSWMEFDYGSEANYLKAAQASSDSGASWANVATNAVLLHQLEFNNAQLEGAGDNAASKTKYANFVPSGVLSASVVDLALQTQDAVDKEAAALAKLRGDVVQRIRLEVPLGALFDANGDLVDVGKQVRLTKEAAQRFGLDAQTDLDVVEVEVDFTDPKEVRGVLILNDHFPDDDTTLAFLASLASQRRI